MMDSLSRLFDAYATRCDAARAALDKAVAAGDEDAIAAAGGVIDECEAAIDRIYEEIRVASGEPRDLDAIRHDPATYLDALGEYAPRLLGADYEEIAVLRDAQNIVDDVAIVLPTFMLPALDLGDEDF